MDEPSPKLVLIMEDDQDLARMLRFWFERDGYAVQHVSDGAAAMDRLLDAEIPRLVVLDVLMPYRNGFEILSEMRRLDSWKEVPVIFLTSKNSDQDVLRGLQLGADDYLAKPFRPAELLARAKRLTGKR